MKKLFRYLVRRKKVFFVFLFVPPNRRVGARRCLLCGERLYSGSAQAISHAEHMLAGCL